MDPEKEAKLNFLDEQRDVASEDLQPAFIQIAEYYDARLWHELTGVLQDVFANPESASQRLALFRTFVLSFAEKINQLSFVHLGLLTATQCQDDKERLTFLTHLAEKVDKPSSQDAYVYSLVAVAEVKIALNDYEGARKDLDKAESVLDTFDSVEQQVHANFYRISASYAQNKADFTSYYKNALLYLACIDLFSLSTQDAQTRAYDLSIAALVSDSIYNFGELLLHPILDNLSSTTHTWLRDLLYAFNRGDLRAYHVLEANLSKAPLLESHKEFLWQKISLSALTEAVFRRPAHDRAMTFQTISHETQVQMNQIEILIMKALSLGLLRGSIDQVSEVARINWVQPKVLDLGQIDSMRKRLKDWDSSVNELGQWIEGVGKDVWPA
ncbi:26S proteasome regulatory subunit [Agyrium rufum]|nr:26S proteasome regulatory subunit [Agyrium rufum]